VSVYSENQQALAAFERRYPGVKRAVSKDRAVGLYGVLYPVAQHTNEIGVRMALGATCRDMPLALSRRGLILTIIGARLLAAMLYGFRPGYATSIAAVSLLLPVAAAVASFLPARRASQVDPVNAMRRSSTLCKAGNA